MSGAILSSCRKRAHSKPILLFAEDDEALRDWYVAVFRSAGFEVHQAANGREALSIAVALRPDVVLLNNRMPLMSGIAACRRLKALKKHKGIPIAVFSACARQTSFVAAQRAGADAYWLKPIEAQDLIARTRKLMEEHPR